jgi:hypothetical protein
MVTASIPRYTYDANFFQEEGLLGNCTINLEIDEDMVIEDKEEKSYTHGGRHSAG